MAVTLVNIKKWRKMLLGKSLLHVRQDAGKIYEAGQVKGYYNDLTDKVIKDTALLDKVEIPTIKTHSGEEVEFPVAVFQYGLGAYDLYLLYGDSIYLEKFRHCADWVVSNQELSGAWNNFFFIYPEHPYSAMAQGEGVSLLLRAYKQFGDNRYIEHAKKAVDFMLTPIESGGTARFDGKRIVLYEYTNSPAVLNGWVFALFGLYDYLTVTDDELSEDIFERSVDTLAEMLPLFDCGYWSRYRLDKTIASPFYHALHIAQLSVLYELTGREVFRNMKLKWEADKNACLRKAKAFVVKAAQKIRE